MDDGEVRKGLMRRFAAYIIVALAGLLGGGSLGVFTVFLFGGSLSLTDLGLDHSGILWLDAGLSLAFFVQHSGMVRRPFRQWLARFAPEEFGGAIYAIASGVVLLAVIVFWQEGARIFTTPPGVFRWLLRALFWLALAGFLWGGLSLKAFDPCGIRPVLRHLRRMKPKPMPFTVKGPYRLIRHPLYFFTILMIWSCPDLTTDRLLFNVIWTVWIVIGAHFEERDLVSEFGDTYREYQRTVSMLIPRRIR